MTLEAHEFNRGYGVGYKDALAAVVEVLEELAQDAFIEEEVVPIIVRAIRLQLNPRSGEVARHAAS